jgi:hypothetical protein
VLIRADGRSAAGLAADPPRIKHVAVAALELIGARALDEERTFLGKVRLERAEIHDCGIGFDLTEVWIDGPGQIQRRRDRVLDVDADRQATIG